MCRQGNTAQVKEASGRRRKAEAAEHPFTEGWFGLRSEGSSPEAEQLCPSHQRLRECCSRQPEPPLRRYGPLRHQPGASRKPCPPCSHPPAFPGSQNNQMSRRQLVPLLRRHLRSDRSEPLRRSGSVALAKCALKIKASLSEGKKSRRVQTGDSGNV